MNRKTTYHRFGANLGDNTHGAVAIRVDFTGDLERIAVGQIRVGSGHSLDD